MDLRSRSADLRSQSEHIGALSVSAGWRDIGVASADVLLTTSIGGWRVRASSCHLLTRVARNGVRKARICVRKANTSEPSALTLRHVRFVEEMAGGSAADRLVFEQLSRDLLDG